MESAGLQRAQQPGLGMHWAGPGEEMPRPDPAPGTTERDLEQALRDLGLARAERDVCREDAVTLWYALRDLVKFVRSLPEGTALPDDVERACQTLAQVQYGSDSE